MKLLIIIPVIFLVGSVIFAVNSVKKGKNYGKALKIQIASFAFVCIMCFALPAVAYATSDNNPTTTASQTENTQDDSGKGMGLIAAAICTGIAGIGSGIAVGGAATAAIGATAEDSKNFGKSLIFVALGEGIAIYGLLVSILILAKV